MTRCGTCNAPIEWVRMQSGRANPVDPLWVVVDPGGMVGKEVQVVCDDGTTARGRAVSSSQDMPGNVKELEDEGYKVGRPSHFSTCPSARIWRRS
ncbi:MAG: hypothetical protein ACYCT1_08320 [Steroidobacteraceae bacterium]